MIFERNWMLIRHRGFRCGWTENPAVRRKSKAHKIAEDISYMRDYVPDSYGRLLRLEFDAVKKEDGYTQKL